MSLLTRCPACTTIYKVVPDQLRISQGWVKCGQCGDIFDATQQLVQIEQPAATPAHPGPANVDSPAPALEASRAIEAELEAEADPTNGREAPEAAFSAHVSVVETELPDSGPASDFARELALFAKSRGKTGQLDGTTEQAEIFDGASATPASGALLKVASQDEATAEPSEDAPALAEPTFMRNARRALFWRKPWVRATLIMSVLMLSLMLVTQAVYRERHYLNAAQPQWRPALQAFCKALGCQIMPLQRIEALVIDVATFNTLGDDRFQLAFSLKNSASVPLAAPSIELTLTDLQDRVVARHVFSARDIDSARQELAPASTWHASVPLALADTSLARRIVGYRVLAFYP